MSSRAETGKKLVLINSASSVAVMLLDLSVLVWLQQYLLGRITPEEYSLLPVLYSVMAFAPLATTILTAGLGRYTVEAWSQGDDERVTQIVSTMFPILGLAGLAFLGGGWTFAWYVGDILNIAPERLWEARIMMALLIFSAAVRLPASPFGVGFFVRQRYVLQNLIRVSTELLRLSILFGLLFGVSTRVMWVVTASAAADLVCLAVTVVVSRRLVPALRVRLSSIRWPVAREICGFGGWSFVTQIAETIRSGADPIILNLLTSAVDVTCFHLGSLPFRQLQRLSMAARSPLEPAVMSLYAQGERERLRNAYLRIGRYSLWMVLAAAVPGIVFADNIISLYVGSEYAGAAAVMALMLLIFPTSYGNCLVGEVARAANAVKSLSLRFVVMHAVNLALTFFFIVRWNMGAVGSALATLVVGVVFQPLLMWPLGWRLTETRPGEWMRRVLVPGCVPALLALCFYVPMKLLFPFSSWLSLMGVGAAGLVIYGAALGACCLQPCDKDDLMRLVFKNKQLFLALRVKFGY